MDLSYSGQIDGFAIATGDRDFVPLAWSLRGRGFQVLGLGPDGLVPETLRKAYSSFISLRLPVPQQPRMTPPVPVKAAQPEPAAKTVPPKASMAPPPMQPAATAAIREVLANGKLRASMFGHKMAERKIALPKGYARWRSVFTRNPTFGVKVTGKGNDLTFSLT